MTTFVVSDKRFKEVIQNGAFSVQPTAIDYSYANPKVGDLIFVPLTKDWWEISNADYETPFFQLGRVSLWRLSVNKYRYSSERINTGDSQLDKLQTALSHDLSIPTSDGQADNTTIQTITNTKLDFSEKDPFSEGVY